MKLENIDVGLENFKITKKQLIEIFEKEYKPLRTELDGQELLRYFKKLHETEYQSKEFYHLKSKILESLGIDASEKINKGQYEEGISTLNIFRKLADYIINMEICFPEEAFIK